MSCPTCRAVEENKAQMMDLIRRAGLTQGQFAEKLNVSSETIRLWSHGRSSPGLDKALDATRILGCSIEQFAIACKIQVETE